jgi:hypothetical protein
LRSHFGADALINAALNPRTAWFSVMISLVSALLIAGTIRLPLEMVRVIA